MTTTGSSDAGGAATGTPTDEHNRARLPQRALLVLVAVVAAAVLLAGVLIGRAGDDGADDWAGVRARCEQTAGTFGVDADRCGEMVAWMADNHRDGRMAGPGSMMGDGAMLRSACNQWLGSGGPMRSEQDEDWCDAMADTMPHGSMMRRP